MKNILIITILFLFIAPIFAQRARSNYGRGRSRRIESKEETDPNSLKNSFLEIPENKKTLENKVKELEYQVEKLERMITNLRKDYKILLKIFDEFKLSNSKEAKAKRREAKRKKNMTEEEKDRAMGYYPTLPRLKYEGKW